jgi:DNA-binding CsgD family transcriptional regulator
MIGGNLWQEALADHVAGRIARGRGALEEAVSLLRRSLVLRVDRGFQPDVADSLEALAGVRTARGEDSAAVRLFAAATALRQEIGWHRRPVDQADYDTDHSAIRQRLGDAAVAAAVAEALEAGAQVAVSAATRVRGRRQGAAAVGWESLTPTEHEVVRLVARGLSNQEVGQRLFMARGTVKVHLGHVFAKLGVTSRAELAAEVTHRQHLTTAS